MMALVRTLWLCLSLALWAGVAVGVQAQNGFAVQVAAVQTRAEAEALTGGLRERGLHAYWLIGEVSGKGVFYRVRVGGQFASTQQATEFGRKLVLAKLISEYTVFRYEAPGAALGASGHALTERANPRERKGGETSRATTPVASKKAGGTPRTDYLISGDPLREPDAAQLIAPPPAKTSGAASTQKHQDEIELDDFKEFAPPMLQGVIEAKDGQLLVTLQNRNNRYRFRGTVKWALSDGEQERPQPAMQIEIAPGQEQVFPLQGSGKSYLLTILDEQGAPLLTQNGAFGSGGRQQVIAENRSPRNLAPNPIGQPGDVPVEQVEEDDGRPRPPRPGEKSVLQTANYPTGKVEDGNPPAETEPAPDAKKDPVQPGDVKVIVRQVAETAENVTIEFEILAREPLGMIAMTIHTASTSDTKQAIMTTKQGRLPFLAPAGDTTGNISYELRNEQGVILATGSKPFRDLAKN